MRKPRSIPWPETDVSSLGSAGGLRDRESCSTESVEHFGGGYLKILAGGDVTNRIHHYGVQILVFRKS